MDIINIKKENEKLNNKLNNILERKIEFSEEIEKVVKEIIEKVKSKKDEAIIEFTKKYDGLDVNINDLIITKDILEDLYNKVSKEILDILKEAKDNIKNYHRYQLEFTWIEEFPNNVKLGQKITPIDSVGVYIPGGKAFYPSSVLMNVVPAKIAGVKRIVAVTPPKNFFDNPIIGATLYLAGVDEVYLIGGAQAIAALAFGTETIRKVDKIVGPGNIYVAMAKREVFGYVDIDMIAGPSEIVVLADDSANAQWVALDLLSQAEHGSGMESAILVTTSERLAKEVQNIIEKELDGFKYENEIKEVLERYGAIIITRDIDEAVDIINKIAPEHLEVVVNKDLIEEVVFNKIKNAGAIFVGEYSSEPVGDYWAGPNHVLPTSSTARFFSPLGVYDFIKRSSLIFYSKEAIIKNALKIKKFAEIENLYFHGKAVYQRYLDINDTYKST